MGEARILQESSRVELMKGEVIEVASKTAKEVSCINRLSRIFVIPLLDQAIVGINNPVKLGQSNELNPNVCYFESQEK